MRELTIDAVGAQGDGLSRNAEGKGAAFVPLTLPGERVLALLPVGPLPPFTLENGQVVTDSGQRRSAG